MILIENIGEGVFQLFIALIAQVDKNKLVGIEKKQYDPEQYGGILKQDDHGLSQRVAGHSEDAD
jgi:hypothetical protein